MEDKIDLKEVKAAFEAHPSVQEFFVTSNGVPFFQKPHAEAHAQDLKDGVVLAVKRSEVMEAPAAPAPLAEQVKSKEQLNYEEALNTPAENRTVYQKGLITKFNKAAAVDSGTTQPAAEDTTGQPGEQAGEQNSSTDENPTV